MPSTRRFRAATDLFLKTTTSAHRAVLDLSGGRLGTRFKRMPTLALTTTGRRTGLPRTVILTVPVVTDSTYLIVASRAGDHVSPDWFHNLCADPSVRVSFQHGATRAMTARVLDPAERDRRWPEVVAAYPGYETYQKRTTRRIPLILLAPVAGDMP
ncbi:nitroreductase/quinone reductase family protein [Nocardia bovistercoris]|uniref:Nitroreductase family deazaflavin-dependent oxidoreductase n=1 Tax=Nocardia bovistercoris TaxID=2785916 RepID=A0A931I7C9_9NOCA|nr:nitroreductase/quinone reductase family protein [Nocardia bovistercoris]MBH0776292.1 nitroreductase family deazaflavin-dependent oxidoreductase [Nocardia bovistercoris]